MPKTTTLFELRNEFQPQVDLSKARIPYGSSGLMIEVETDSTVNAVATAIRIKSALKTGPLNAESMIRKTIMAANKARIPMSCAIQAGPPLV